MLPGVIGPSSSGSPLVVGQRHFAVAMASAARGEYVDLLCPAPSAAVNVPGP